MPTLAQQRDIRVVGQDVLAVQQDAAFRTLFRVQLVHLVEGAQQGICRSRTGR